MNVEGYATAEVPDYLAAFSEGAPIAPSALLDRAMAEAQAATQIFNGFFGKTGFSRIAITQQPEFSFGQSWPSLVYLPHFWTPPVVEQYRNRNATTEDFERVVEKHMVPNMNAAGNGNMDWFFREWVYGTAVPKYRLEQTVTDQPEGKYLLKGSVTQSEVPDDFLMVVPLYLEFDGGPVRVGSLRMSGNTSVPFQVMLPKKPKRVLLNAWHDVLEQQ